MITLVTGGARSGKSRHALELAMPFERRVMIATAEAVDEEIRQRIAAHRAERGDLFGTLEAPLDLAGAASTVSAETEVVVVDCLTLWLGNLIFHRPGSDLADDLETYPQIGALLELLDQRPPWELILVTNEVGMGLVPAEAMSRAFRDLAGRVNQEVARRADRLVFMVSGAPLEVKGPSR